MKIRYVSTPQSASWGSPGFGPMPTDGLNSHMMCHIYEELIDIYIINGPHLGQQLTIMF